MYKNIVTFFIGIILVLSGYAKADTQQIKEINFDQLRARIAKLQVTQKMQQQMYGMISQKLAKDKRVDQTTLGILHKAYSDELIARGILLDSLLDIDLSLQNLEGKDISFLRYPTFSGTSYDSDTVLPKSVAEMSKKELDAKGLLRVTTVEEDIIRSAVYISGLKPYASFFSSHREGLQTVDVASIKKSMEERAKRATKVPYQKFLNKEFDLKVSVD